MWRRMRKKSAMKDSEVIDNIRQVAASVLPKGSSLYLYGSRARGDAREGSDWDLLLLLDKAHLSPDDYDATYPFRELGWGIGEEINPHIYTETQWRSWTFLPFYKNVERDKVVLYES